MMKDVCTSLKKCVFHIFFPSFLPPLSDIQTVFQRRESLSSGEDSIDQELRRLINAPSEDESSQNKVVDAVLQQGPWTTSFAYPVGKNTFIHCLLN